MCLLDSFLDSYGNYYGFPYFTVYASFTGFQEVPENGADVAHLYQVHNPVIFAGIDLSTMWSKYLSFACHKWTASWTQNPAPEEHIGSLSLTHDLNVFGKSISPLFLSVQARQVCKFSTGPKISGIYQRNLRLLECHLALAQNFRKL